MPLLNWVDRILDYFDPDEPPRYTDDLTPSDCPCGAAYPHTHFGDGQWSS